MTIKHLWEECCQTTFKPQPKDLSCYRIAELYPVHSSHWVLAMKIPNAHMWQAFAVYTAISQSFQKISFLHAIFLLGLQVQNTQACSNMF